MDCTPQGSVLVVDDSAVTRSLLRSVVSLDLSAEVAGTAVDGETAPLQLKICSLM